MGHASEKLRTPEAYWLFKRVADSVKCLCVLELANGDYWVIDSPTGTYMSGHADRWHWRLAEAEYLAQGYVREFEAKSRGLIPPSWSRATPDPTRLVARHRVRATILMLLIITAAVMLALFVPRLLMRVIGR
ncbi:MAG: hypothetical protein DME03_21705 [Candidatus Rokuibacteriota bacterium]|nr:MAG: hypothetical protein DME03_21705 [Candidatus Rokubacteria bacterium]